MLRIVSLGRDEGCIIIGGMEGIVRLRFRVLITHGEVHIIVLVD